MKSRWTAGATSILLGSAAAHGAPTRHLSLHAPYEHLALSSSLTLLKSQNFASATLLGASALESSAKGAASAVHDDRSFWDGSRKKAWIPALLGGLLVGEGVGLYLMARSIHDDLHGQRDDISSARAGSSLGRTYQWIGVGSVAVGTLALGAAAAMFFLDTSHGGISATVSGGGNGAVASFTAELP